MFIIKNAAGGYFIGYQKDANDKYQPCFMFEHGGEQEMPVVIFHTKGDVDVTLKTLTKKKHIVYAVEI